MILLTSLTDALTKWNEPFCERLSSISFILEYFLDESLIGFTISLSVNDGLIASSFEGILPEAFLYQFLLLNISLAGDTHLEVR